MTLSTTGFTLGANQPLNRARILWNPITGTIVAGGTNGALAANDFPHQRWALAAGSMNWTVTAAANTTVDSAMIAGHNLAGKTLLFQTATAVGGPYTTRATVVPADNSTIAVLFNTATGLPHTVRECRLNVSDGTGVFVGVIRFGEALQMPIPVFGGHGPMRFNRSTEMRQAISETGNWLGRTEQARRISARYGWDYLDDAWYAANFEPFARTLPVKPFGIIGNAQRMGGADVGWCYTESDVSPSYMGIRNFMSVGLDVTGFWE